jgi:predicted transglutaminase-like cysteine proteinase
MPAFKIVAALLLASLACGCANAPAYLTSSIPIFGRVKPVGDEANPPPGYVDFCSRYADECAPNLDAPTLVSLTPSNLDALRLVNVAMNKSIRPKDDKAHYGLDDYWTIPVDGFGDCDDYVLVKRKALMILGFPQSALRIAEVYAARFELHAVLVVTTDSGNFVLDNLTDEVRPWERSDYAWIKWQNPESPTGWKSLQ